MTEITKTIVDQIGHKDNIFSKEYSALIKFAEEMLNIYKNEE